MRPVEGKGGGRRETAEWGMWRTGNERGIRVREGKEERKGKMSVAGRWLQ